MTTIDGYTLTKTLGQGFSAKVKLAHDSQGNEYALKIFDLNNPKNNKKAMDLLKKEVEACNKLQYKHIVKYHEFKEDSNMLKANGESVPVAYIAQEAIQGGELFDYVANSGAFSEPICRYYFKQMLLGLHFIHKNGFSHRDLKPENILLDHNYDLKIVDFGFACPLEGRDGTGFNRSLIGTPGYMAPEILEKQPYQGQVVDLFAAAVILFIMYTQHPPFQMAKAEDVYYKLLATNRSDLFWQAHQQRKKEDFFSKEFKDLITSMLQLHPHQRLCMADLIGHPWLAGETATAEEVRAEFARRQEVCKAKKTQAVQNKTRPAQTKKVRRGVKQGEKIYLSSEPTAEEAKSPNIVKINMKQCAPDMAIPTAFFTNLEADSVLSEIESYLVDKGLQFQISNCGSKVLYTKTEASEGEQIVQNEIALLEQADIQIQLLDAGESLVGIQFRRKQGSSMIVHNEFNILRERFEQLQGVEEAKE